MLKAEISKDIDFLGFIDKTQAGKDIFKIDEIKDNDFDYILIHSPNHFSSIYKDYSKKVSKDKLIKVDTINNSYVFF